MRSETRPMDFTTRLELRVTMRSVRIQLGAGSLPPINSAGGIGKPCSDCCRDVTGRAIKSPWRSGSVSASTGRRLAADKSENGNGTSSSSPRSSIVPDFVLGVIPHRDQRSRLSIHEVPPIAVVPPVAQVDDKIEHLAGKLVWQSFDLFIDHFGDCHVSFSGPFSGLYSTVSMLFVVVPAASIRRYAVVPITVTILDIRHPFSYIQRIKSRSVKDAFREGIPEVGASAVPAGRPIQPASGRFGHQPAGTRTGARGASLEVGNGVGGVKPAAWTPPPTKPGPTLSLWDEILPLARAVVERRKAGGLCLSPPPPPKKVRRFKTHACRRSASLFPRQRKEGRSLLPA